jgi:hypothetical protein
VFGGHGYVREWGIEQIVRDARVAMIYEGTNEIQAIDLLVRKVLPDGGAALALLLREIDVELDLSRDADAATLRRFADLNQLTQALVEASKVDAVLPYRVADDYLRLLALALLGWAWTRIEAAAGDEPRQRWRAPAVLTTRVLPEFDMLVASLAAQCAVCSKPT